MLFLHDLLLGIRSYYSALIFIWEQRLYWYIFIPAMLMLGIYKIGESIQGRIYHPRVENMNEIVWFLLHMLLEISLGLLLMNFAKYIVVIVLSPLLAHLSQKTERLLTGRTYPFDFEQFLRDVKRGIRIAFRNLLWQYFFFLIIFLVSFVGWKDPKGSPVFYLVYATSFYYYGFSFMDYMNERRKLGIKESVAFVRKHWGMAMGIGAVYSILILVPVDLGVLFSMKHSATTSVFEGILIFLYHLILWIGAASAPVLAIVAATIGMNALLKRKASAHK